MNEVYEFLKKCGTYYLATVEGDQPRVRPFGTVDIFEGKLYIQTGKVKAVSKQLQANPKAEICAFADGTWVRVAGELIPPCRPCTPPRMTTPRSCISKMRRPPSPPSAALPAPSPSDHRIYDPQTLDIPYVAVDRNVTDL